MQAGWQSVFDFWEGQGYHGVALSRGGGDTYEDAMWLRWLLATLHLLALGIELAVVWLRGRALRGPLDKGNLQRVFLADIYLGIAAVLWLVTGLLREFVGFEKGTSYYLQNDAFLLKMVLLGLILVLDTLPIVTVIRWQM